MNVYTKKPGEILIKRQIEKKLIPIVSIFIFYKKNDNNFQQTLYSILNQTFTEFELIILTNDKINILEKDNRIKIQSVKNANNIYDYAVTKSNNLSKYLLFIESGDLLDQTFLEAAFYSLERNEEAGWAYCNAIDLSTNETIKYETNSLLKENITVKTSLIRKDVFLKVKGFEINDTFDAENWYLWLKFAEAGIQAIHISSFAFWQQKLNINVMSEIISKKVKQLGSIKLKDEIEFPCEEYFWERIEDNNISINHYKKSEKRNVLVIIPWMTVGGADQFNIDLISLTNHEKYNFIVITTIPNSNVWRVKFENCCEAIFDLPNFLKRKDWPAFIQYIIESRNIDLLFVSNSLTGYEFLPYLKAMNPSLPIMDYIHMEEWYNRNGGFSRDSAAFGSIIDRTLFCNRASEKIMAEFFKRDPETLGTVYIGVDEKKYDPEKYNKEELIKKYSIPDHKFVIGMVARIDYQKRPYLLMEIVKKISKVYNDILFIVAGDGPLFEDMLNIIKTNSLEKNIRFIGRTNTPEEIYIISDMTINCSIKEGLALTAYESLALGKPVLSSDVGGQKELINDEVGVIVPCLQKEEDAFVLKYSEQEVNSYVDGIIKIKNNISCFKEKCRKRILSDFTINKMAINMEKEFEKIITENHEDTTKRGNELFNSMDILKEGINQYLLADKYTYAFACTEIKNKLYDQNYMNINKSILFKIDHKLQGLATRCHLINEYKIISRGVYKFVKSFWNIFESIFGTIYKLFRCIFKRIYNGIKKII